MVNTLTNDPWDPGAALSVHTVYFNRKGTQPCKFKKSEKTAWDLKSKIKHCRGCEEKE